MEFASVRPYRNRYAVGSVALIRIAVNMGTSESKVLAHSMEVYSEKIDVSVTVKTTVQSAAILPFHSLRL